MYNSIMKTSPGAFGPFSIRVIQTKITLKLVIVPSARTEKQ